LGIIVKVFVGCSCPSNSLLNLLVSMQYSSESVTHAQPQNITLWPAANCTPWSLRHLCEQLAHGRQACVR